MSSNNTIPRKKIWKRRLRRVILNRYNLKKWDEVRCIKCDQLSDNMEIHHLEFVSQNKKRTYDCHNVVQICHNCHTEFHVYCNDLTNDTEECFVEWLGVPLHYHMLKYVPRETKWYHVFDGFNCHKAKGNKGIFYLVRSTGC